MGKKSAKKKRFGLFAGIIALLIIALGMGVYYITNAVTEADDGIDADFYIDNENGTIPIGDLPIGTRVVDPTWVWEYRLGLDYSDYNASDRGEVFAGKAKIRPVTWIIVASDHYDELEPHVTLLAAEPIGKYSFDNCSVRGSIHRSKDKYSDITDLAVNKSGYGSNHWGESGTGSATLGLRPWLNSSGIHAGEGFYQSFSDSFKKAVLTTKLPNKEWSDGGDYTTEDRVFIPSITELGDNYYDWAYQIGSVYPFFSETESTSSYGRRLVLLKGDIGAFWTRTPCGGMVFAVFSEYENGSDINNMEVHYTIGVLPALNLKSDVLVSEVIKE